MRRALEYAASVRRVRAWPDDIKDGTVRRLRREGYVETFVTSGMQLGSGVRFGGGIDDEITDKGRAALAEGVE
jgi:hypothetical protein